MKAQGDNSPMAMALRALREASDVALRKRYEKAKPEEEQEEKSDEYEMSDDDLAALAGDLEA